MPPKERQLILPPASPDIISFEMFHDGQLVAGAKTSVLFRFTIKGKGLPRGSRLRIGLPNTGWEKPVVPQQRYWDELVNGLDRRLATFHPVNTTATIRSERKAAHTLEVMERMLLPDEDPAFAYWRWWITFTLEAEDLVSGDQVEVLYGDWGLGSYGARIQTFPEVCINVLAFVDWGGQGAYLTVDGTPLYFDVTAGPAARANLVVPSVRLEELITCRVSITDECHAVPSGSQPIRLVVGDQPVACIPGTSHSITLVEAERVRAFSDCGTHWGESNRSVPIGTDRLQLFWGDLHGQSEHHVMHSQAKDFRQEGWSKGISSGTLDECYQYAREVSLLDFVAITDQGACLTNRWEYCQQKVKDYHRPGEFVVFKGYEAGSIHGHRNVIYLTDEIDPRFDAKQINGFHPLNLYAQYRGRTDVVIIPHHVKTWTNWSYYDPELEPVMEIYSCWGQSESIDMDLWNKALTPGAGAWEALSRGYKLGLIASTDNHVGMPGRSYIGDRQGHTPFKGGLCAIWAPELTRDSLFHALKERRCYGTTGSRLLMRFTIDNAPMGSVLPVSTSIRKLSVEVQGTHAIDRVEIIRNSMAWRTITPERQDDESLLCTLDIPSPGSGYYYVRVFQKDGERGWSSPIWIDETL